MILNHPANKLIKITSGYLDFGFPPLPLPSACWSESTWSGFAFTWHSLSLKSYRSLERTNMVFPDLNTQAQKKWSHLGGLSFENQENSNYLGLLAQSLDMTRDCKIKVEKTVWNREKHDNHRQKKKPDGNCRVNTWRRGIAHRHRPRKPPNVDNLCECICGNMYQQTSASQPWHILRKLCRFPHRGTNKAFLM